MCIRDRAEQAETVQKVVNELIIAKKIKLLFRREALAAFEGTNPLINITPEVIELINQESEE